MAPQHFGLEGIDSGPSLRNQTIGSKSAPMPLLATNTKALKSNYQNRGSLTKHDPQRTTLKCLKLNARSVSKLTWADHLLVSWIL